MNPAWRMSQRRVFSALTRAGISPFGLRKAPIARPTSALRCIPAVEIGHGERSHKDDALEFRYSVRMLSIGAGTCGHDGDVLHAALRLRAGRSRQRLPAVLPGFERPRSAAVRGPGVRPGPRHSRPDPSDLLSQQLPGRALLFEGDQLD